MTPRDLLTQICLRMDIDEATRATAWTVSVFHENHPDIFHLYGPFADAPSALLYAIEREREENSAPGESGWVCRVEPVLPSGDGAEGRAA